MTEGENEMVFDEKKASANTFRRRMTQAFDALNLTGEDLT